MEETSGADQSEAPARRVNEIDATGQAVAANVKRLRTELGLTTAQLADRLEAVGRPILANAITKIEQRQRRVSVDDLMALAAALGATPNALLLPADLAERSQPTGVASPVGGNILWAWACGDRPLPLSADPSAKGASADNPDDSEARTERFRAVAAPHSTSPDAFLRTHEATGRSMRALIALLETTPQMAEVAEEYVQSLAKKWGEMAELLERGREEIKSQEVDTAELARAIRLMDAQFGK